MRLGLIPARGGSKGIPRKNIRKIAGKPLIVWTIEAALAARSIDRVVVSTDNAEIADIARAAGAEVPFTRPAELAGDTAPGIAPVLHALDMLPECSELVLLQPTSPLRRSVTIDALVDFATESASPSVVSVCAVEHHPALMYSRRETGQLAPFAQDERSARRQDLPPLYRLNGAIYFADAERVRREASLLGDDTLGFVTEAEESVDIDTMLDWRIAEMLLMDRIEVDPALA